MVLLINCVFWFDLDTGEMSNPDDYGAPYTEQRNPNKIHPHNTLNIINSVLLRKLAINKLTR
jgi:hypothetical protein